MTWFRILALGCACVVAACGQTSDPGPAVDGEDILTSTDSSRDIGEFTVHVNAIGTDELSAEVASLYGIARSQNRALLNVNVQRRNDAGTPSPSRASVMASATNLSGQLRNLTMREIIEGDAIYYIGETVITNAETLVFTIQIMPEGAAQPYTLRYMRQFFID